MALKFPTSFENEDLQSQRNLDRKWILRLQLAVKKHSNILIYNHSISLHVQPHDVIGNILLKNK